jgi:hypothetical protein
MDASDVGGAGVSANPRAERSAQSIGKLSISSLILPGPPRPSNGKHAGSDCHDDGEK